MLLIFDLDDTLIDTSHFITPRKMEEALRAMAAAGLCIGDFASDLKDLLAINASSDSSPTALKTFLTSRSYPLDFLSMGLEKLREPLAENFEPVLAVPHTLSMLQEAKSRHQLAIVSVGIPQLQFSKLKKAGIDPAFFSKIDIIEEKNKKPSYEMLMQEAKIPPHQVVVCGDRVAIDLAPAKALGCYTVHLARGRGYAHRESALSTQLADYAIEDWRDFSTLLESIKIN